MRRFFSFLTVSLVAGIMALAPVSFTHAQLDKAMSNLDKAVGDKSGTGLSRDLTGTIGTVVRGVLAITGTIFFLLTIYAGILWMTAQGDEGKIEKAQSIIKACVMGLIITLSAYSVTYFVGNRLTRAAAPASSTAAK